MYNNNNKKKDNKQNNYDMKSYHTYRINGEDEDEEKKLLTSL